jgi:hypothetical protein
MDKLVQDTYLTKNSRLLILRKVKTVTSSTKYTIHLQQATTINHPKYLLSEQHM